jgi:hypothetical protein
LYKLSCAWAKLSFNLLFGGGFMMRTHSRFLLFILPAVFFLLSAPARALGPGGDLYFGYSRAGSNDFVVNAPGLNGWQAAGHIHVFPFVGAELDVAHYGLGAASNDARTTTVMAGPRVTVGAAGIHVFAHGLVGVEHSYTVGGPFTYSNNNLAAAGGGGVDFRIFPFFAWRVTGDYIGTTNSPSNSSHARFGTGLVFRF